MLIAASVPLHDSDTLTVGVFAALLEITTVSLKVWSKAGVHVTGCCSNAPGFNPCEPLFPPTLNVARSVCVIELIWSTCPPTFVIVMFVG